MMKTFLRILVGVGFVTLVFGTQPAYAIFGIRAARKVVAARKAANAVTDPTPEEAYAQEKAKFGEHAVQKDESSGQF